MHVACSMYVNMYVSAWSACAWPANRTFQSAGELQQARVRGAGELQQARASCGRRSRARASCSRRTRAWASCSRHSSARASCSRRSGARASCGRRLRARGELAELRQALDCCGMCSTARATVGTIPFPISMVDFPISVVLPFPFVRSPLKGHASRVDHQMVITIRDTPLF